jgi:hypothetical protein
LGRGLVLLHHAGRDTSPFADGDAVIFRPGADIAAALAAGRAADRPMRLRSAPLAGMLDERRELLAEGGGVFGAEVDLSRRRR